MKVVIVEDDQTTAKFLKVLIGRWGYEIEYFPSGPEGWDFLRLMPDPCIAVLDWMMPELSGREICSMIRDREDGPLIYTILLTGKVSHEDKVRGLESGANAYVRKPFDAIELKSCMEAGARIIEYERDLSKKKDEIEQYASQMEDLAEARSHQLVHSDRMASIGLLSAGVAHEINNPTTFIAGNSQTIEQAWQMVCKELERAAAKEVEENSQIQYMFEEVPKMFAGIRKGVDRIQKITSSLKSYVRNDSMASDLFSINTAIEDALELCHNRLKTEVKVVVDLDDTIPQVRGDLTQICQVVVNLLVNAADAMKGRAEAEIHIGCWTFLDRLEIIISDNGPGIPEADLKRIFEAFYTTKGVGDGTGLGLSISHGIIQDHGGDICVENGRNGGARFTIDLPFPKCQTDTITEMETEEKSSEATIVNR